MGLKRIGTDEEILAFITKTVEERGYPPSQREIAERWGVTKTSANQVIERLKRDGRIEVAPGVARGIRVMKAETERL